MLEDESRRFLETLASADLDAAVPSCPGWLVADLLYLLEFGRMTGTSPGSDRTYDLDAAELRDDPSPSATAEVSGSAWDLDRWLWGRGDAARLTICGPPQVVARLRTLAADATQ